MQVNFDLMAAAPKRRLGARNKENSGAGRQPAAGLKRKGALARAHRRGAGKKSTAADAAAAADPFDIAGDHKANCTQGCKICKGKFMT